MTENTDIELINRRTTIAEISRKIIIIRGERVILDEDLAILYEITTGNLNKAVKRNQERFPSDFMFELTSREFEALKFQTGRAKLSGRGGRRTSPLAYTEHGILMAATVLRSDSAIQMSLYIMRVFVRLRKLIKANPELNDHLLSLDQRYLKGKNQFAHLLDALTALLDSTHPEVQGAKATRKLKSRESHTYTLEFTEANEQAVKFLEALGATLGEGVVTTDFGGETK